MDIKNTLKNNKSSIVRFIILALSLLSIYFTYIYLGKNRETIALNIFNYSNYISTSKDDYETKYYNKYYKKNLPLQLKDYYITGSYKSYLATGSTYSIPSIKTIENVIKKGARFLHLDVYSDGQILDPTANPIVRDKTLLPRFGHSIKLEECFKTISSNGWKSTSAPILLYLETHFYNTDNVMCNKIVALLNKYFSSRFVDKSYSFNNKNISDIEIKNARNKIIIFTNRNDYLGNLTEYINGVISSYITEDDIDENTQKKNENNTPKYEVNVYNYTRDMDSYGGISSSYNNVDEIIENSKINLSLSRPVLSKSIENLFNPVSDLFNIDPTSSYDNGIQIVCMNYQYFDKNMKKYLDFFKDGSLKVKPDNLRHIPKPPVVIKKQKKDLSYAPRQITTKGNWKTFYI